MLKGYGMTGLTGEVTRRKQRILEQEQEETVDEIEMVKMVADVSNTAIPFIIHDRGWDAEKNYKDSLRRLEKKIIRHLLIGYLQAEMERTKEAKRGRIMKDPEVKEFRQFIMVQYLMVVMEHTRPKKKRRTQRVKNHYHSNSVMKVKI